MLSDKNKEYKIPKYKKMNAPLILLPEGQMH